MYKLITGYLKIGTTLDMLQENALVTLIQNTDDTDCIVRTANDCKAKTGDLFDIIGHNPIFIVKALDVFFQNGFITYNADKQTECTETHPSQLPVPSCRYTKDGRHSPSCRQPDEETAYTKRQKSKKYFPP